MNKALYPGIFDPITIGHLDIIKRAARLYDEVIVAIMHNPKKNCTFSPEERKSLIERCVDLSNVKVVIGEGLTVDLARQLGCKVLVRGIRAIADYEYELALATTNMRLAEDIETVFLVARPEFSFISSSIAKEVALYDGDLSGIIPEVISCDVLKKL